MALAFLLGGCAANPTIDNLDPGTTIEDVRAVGKRDLENRDWNVPDWYRRSIYVSPTIGSYFFSEKRWGSYTFIYTGLFATFGLFLVMFFVYMSFIVGFDQAYFWIVTGLSILAIPVFSFVSSALVGAGMPWHFSMFCVFALGTVAPPLLIALSGAPALAASLAGPIADAHRRRADKAAKLRAKRAQAQAERQALATQAQTEKQRRNRIKEASVHEKLRNVELVVGELCLCAADERAGMERELLHTVMELTGSEKVIRADPDGLNNIRNVLQMLDRLGYDKRQLVYLKLASLVR